VAETNSTGTRMPVTLWLTEQEITALLLLLQDRPYLREYVALGSREAMKEADRPLGPSPVAPGRSPWRPDR
jgi:hypothetical protein